MVYGFRNARVRIDDGEEEEGEVGTSSWFNEDPCNNLQGRVESLSTYIHSEFGHMHSQHNEFCTQMQDGFQGIYTHVDTSISGLRIHFNQQFQAYYQEQATTQAQILEELHCLNMQGPPPS